MKKFLLILLLSGSLFSCKDSTISQYNALGKEHIVIQFGADGKQIGKWTSTGSISNEPHSDGWYFEDSATHKLVELTGTVQIFVK